MITRALSCFGSVSTTEETVLEAFFVLESIRGIMMSSWKDFTILKWHLRTNCLLLSWEEIVQSLGWYGIIRLREDVFVASLVELCNAAN
jgi:hypothetical protein